MVTTQPPQLVTVETYRIAHKDSAGYKAFAGAITLGIFWATLLVLIFTVGGTLLSVSTNSNTNIFSAITVVLVGICIMVSSGTVGFRWYVYCAGPKGATIQLSAKYLVADQNDSYDTHYNMIKMYVEHSEDLPEKLRGKLYQALHVLERLATSNADTRAESYIKVRANAFEIGKVCATHLNKNFKNKQTLPSEELILEAEMLTKNLIS